MNTEYYLLHPRIPLAVFRQALSAKDIFSRGRCSALEDWVRYLNHGIVPTHVREFLARQNHPLPPLPPNVARLAFYKGNVVPLQPPHIH